MVNLVAVLRLSDAKVIPVCGEDHVLVRFLRPFEYSDDIFRIDSPHLIGYFDGGPDAQRNGFEILLERFLLHIVEVKTRRFEQGRRYVASDPALDGNRRTALVRL